MLCHFVQHRLFAVGHAVLVIEHVGITRSTEILFPSVLVGWVGLRLFLPKVLLVFIPCGVVLIYYNTADFLGFLLACVGECLKGSDAAQ